MPYTDQTEFINANQLERETEMVSSGGENQVYAFLVLQDGYGVRKEFPIIQSRTIIGRESNRSDVIIDDPTVSAIHCVITFERGNFYLQDLGSLNGTYVNPTSFSGKGNPIKSVLLHNHDRIKIGRSSMTFIKAS